MYFGLFVYVFFEDGVFGKLVFIFLDDFKFMFFDLNINFIVFCCLGEGCLDGYFFVYG